MPRIWRGRLERLGFPRRIFKPQNHRNSLRCQDTQGRFPVGPETSQPYPEQPVRGSDPQPFWSRASQDGELVAEGDVFQPQFSRRLEGRGRAVTTISIHLNTDSQRNFSHIKSNDCRSIHIFCRHTRMRGVLSTIRSCFTAGVATNVATPRGLPDRLPPGSLCSLLQRSSIGSPPQGSPGSCFP